MNDLQVQYEVLYGPGNYIPPAIIPYWTFRIMVGSGFLMIALAIYALFLVMGELFEKRPRMMKFFLWAIALPYLANTSGWLLTEVGRFPWVVFGLVKLEDGISPNVSTGALWVSLIGYLLVYGVVMGATAYLLVIYAKAGPLDGEPGKPAEEEGEIPSLVGAQD
jgi:cytochrome d ubiquinol oxidase subunit I